MAGRADRERRFGGRRRSEPRVRQELIAMTDKAISPLRQRMIEDMTARHFAEKVQTDYIRHVKNFVAFLDRSPDTATSEDLHLYQLHMTKSRVSPPSINAAILALRFFFRTNTGMWPLKYAILPSRLSKASSLVMWVTPAGNIGR